MTTGARRRVLAAAWGACLVLGMLLLACLFLTGFSDTGPTAPLPRMSRPPGRRPARPAEQAKARAEEDSPVPLDAALPFQVAPGYVAERVAAPPLVRHPIFACFDERGRLFVAGSTGHNLPPEELMARPPEVIRCLEDSNGDGVFDKSRVFADRLTYPQGVLCFEGAVYTASPPSLWRLEDADGDGVAESRRELVTGFPFTGIADDLHGPCIGPDGRLYWGVGRFPYGIRKPGGPILFEGRSPLIMRCRPDGEELEVYSAAMGNPVEVSFTPEGEPVACGTFLSPDAQGAGFRDALIHCVYGGVYSVRDGALPARKRTGELLPPLVHLGVAAGAGLTFARGGPFGIESRLALYPAMFNLHSVPRFVLEREGATFRAHEEPFLTSSATDFHPTDVLEDADGSLLVVDTGEWFRACPTSQLEKPNTLGAIYRIRRVGAVRLADPWGQKLDWKRPPTNRLAWRLADRRFKVRERAGSALVQRGQAGLPALRRLLRGGSQRVRLQALRVLTRLGGDGARDLIREALSDDQASVRLAAATAVGLLRDTRAADRLRVLLRSDTPAVRREAANALGRFGQGTAAGPLLEALRAGPDRFLEHALIYALILIGDREATLPGLGDASPAVQRGALIALDQMDEGGLTLELVTPLLAAADLALRQAALKVAAAHPEWAAAMAQTLQSWLAHQAAPVDPAALKHQLVAYSQDSAIQEVIAQALGQTRTPAANRILLLEVMDLAQLDEWPPSWIVGLRKALADRDDQVARHAVSTVRANNRLAFEAPLLELARDRLRGRDLRVEALDAVAPRLRQIEAPLFGFLVAQLDLDEPPLRRLAAARALGRAPLDEDQLVRLCRVVATSGALTLPHLLPAYERCRSPRVATALAAALARAPGLRALRPNALERAFRGCPAEVRHQVDPLIRKLEQPEAEKASRLAELAHLLGRGNALRGREVFFGLRAACSTCHTVRGEGGHVGPDLSRIGGARNGRDLLESILFPSASFARGFEPYVIALEDGRVQTGVILNETGDSIVVATPDRLALPIPRRAIEAIEPSRVSVMPQGLEANLDQTELAHLLAFLQSLK